MPPASDETPLASAPGALGARRLPPGILHPTAVPARMAGWYTSLSREDPRIYGEATTVAQAATTFTTATVPCTFSPAASGGAHIHVRARAGDHPDRRRARWAFHAGQGADHA